MEDAKDLLERARRVDAAIASKVITISDDKKMVSVKISETGHISELKIADVAMRHPDLLGRRITHVVTRARKASRTLSDKAREKYLPELPGKSDTAPESAPHAVDFHVIDYGGPVAAKNAIAKAMESMAKLKNIESELRARRLRCDLNSGIGYIESSVDKSSITVVIDPTAVGSTISSRLERQVVEALHHLDQKAARIKQDYLFSIPLGATSLGAMLNLFR
jgi:DNA-binding protein YbaB